MTVIILEEVSVHEADRKRYDFLDSNVSMTKGLVTGRKDPLGHETKIQWNTTYSILPTRVTDPGGHDPAGHACSVKRKCLNYQ
jgi:hypothetical protein